MCDTTNNEISFENLSSTAVEVVVVVAVGYVLRSRIGGACAVTRHSEREEKNTFTKKLSQSGAM